MKIGDKIMIVDPTGLDSPDFVIGGRNKAGRVVVDLYAGEVYEIADKWGAYLRLKHGRKRPWIHKNVCVPSPEKS